MKIVQITVLILLKIIVYNNAARILAVFPTPSISHQVVFRSFTQELAKRGHEVLVVTTDPAFPDGNSPENLKEVDMHNASYALWIKTLSESQKSKQDHATSQVELILNSYINIVKGQLLSQEMQYIIKNNTQKFDLLILEACARPILILSHIFKAPVIQFSSFGPMLQQIDVVGAPSHPLLYPSNWRKRLYNLTLIEKVTELYSHYQLLKTLSASEIKEENMLKEIFGHNIPSLRELEDNIDMVFLNMHSIWLDNQPMPPNVVYLGGLHQKPEKELPQDLKNYLDTSKNGVIYVSFGTNVLPSLLPQEKIRAFIKVFSQLPYNILWKWDRDDLPGRSENIKVSKWLPQSDLLRHPNLKLFITQGGLQSTDEAITAGVPLIGVPMLGDQWYNVEKYVKHKIGKRLDLETITENNLKKAIEEIMNDKSYRQNIIRLRNYMKDQSEKPLDRAVWWTEYVLRHGGARQLRSPAANMSWAEYLELELVAITLAIFLVIISIKILVARYLLRILKVSKNVLMKKVKLN